MLGAPEEEDWLICIAALLQVVCKRWSQIIPHLSTAPLSCRFSMMMQSVMVEHTTAYANWRKI